MKTYNYLDLFHGIGGFALGAYWAGMKFDRHYCSDIEPYCQKLYAQRFPDSVQLGDIAKINAADLPAGEWIISGGFPCQDISIAGKGAGIHGERSGLWFEYWRLIRDLRPRFAVMENVGMLVHRGLREVLGSLAEIGYDAEWQDIRASDVGAPHRRERIWIVAYAGPEGIHKRRIMRNVNAEMREPRGMVGDDISEGERREGGDVADASDGDTQQRCASSQGSCQCESEREKTPSSGVVSRQGILGRIEKKWNNQCRIIQEKKGNVADAAAAGLQGQEPARSRSGEPGLSSECGYEFPDAESKQAGGIFKRRIQADIGADCDRRGQAPTWSTEPDVGMLVDGLPSGLDRFEGRLSNNAYKRVDQLKGLGNSILPQISELLFNRIKVLL